MRSLLAIISAFGTVVLGVFLTLSGKPLSVQAAGGGAISGKIVLVGDVPAAKKLKVTKDNEKCGSEVTAEDLVVAPDRGIQNAVVTVLGQKGTVTKPDNPPTLDQKGCVFRPHVLIVPVNTGVDILNSDGILHNFHTQSSKNTPINRAQPGFRKRLAETFGQPEIIKVNCDAHSWMSAWIVVTDHPYIAASDAGGMFKISDVPPGNHTIEIWHETLGKITKTVSVKAGEEAKLNIEMNKK